MNPAHHPIKSIRPAPPLILFLSFFIRIPRFIIPCLTRLAPVPRLLVLMPTMRPFLVLLAYPTLQCFVIAFLTLGIANLTLANPLLALISTFLALAAPFFILQQ